MEKLKATLRGICHGIANAAEWMHLVYFGTIALDLHSYLWIVAASLFFIHMTALLVEEA